MLRRACAACLLLAPRAWPAPSGPAVSLAWVREAGAESCITRQDIVGRVREKLGSNPFDGQPGQWLEGVIRREDQSFAATLYERDAEGNTLGTRVFRSNSEDCRELDEAIVLAVALLIDPEGGRTPASRDHEVTLGSTPHGQRDDAKTAPQSKTPPSPRATRRNKTRDGTGHRERPSERVHTGALLAHGMLPGWALGLTLELQVWVDWPIRAAVFHFPEQVERTSDGSLGLTASALELGLCTPGVEDARVWPLGCLSVAGGALHSAAYADVPRPPLERFWGAVRGDFGLEARIVGPLGIDARMVAWLPMVRYRFRVAGEPTVFVQPWLIGGVQAAMTLQLW